MKTYYLVLGTTLSLVLFSCTGVQTGMQSKYFGYNNGTSTMLVAKNSSETIDGNEEQMYYDRERNITRSQRFSNNNEFERTNVIVVNNPSQFGGIGYSPFFDSWNFGWNNGWCMSSFGMANQWNNGWFSPQFSRFGFNPFANSFACNNFFGFSNNSMAWGNNPWHNSTTNTRALPTNNSPRTWGNGRVVTTNTSSQASGNGTGGRSRTDDNPVQIRQPLVSTPPPIATSQRKVSSPSTFQQTTEYPSTHSQPSVSTVPTLSTVPKGAQQRFVEPMRMAEPIRREDLMRSNAFETDDSYSRGSNRGYSSPTNERRNYGSGRSTTPTQQRSYSPSPERRSAPTVSSPRSFSPSPSSSPSNGGGGGGGRRR